jgi:hypothetical protein
MDEEMWQIHTMENYLFFKREIKSVICINTDESGGYYVR